MAPGADLLLWLVDADGVDDAVLDSCAAWLGDGERARCARFVRPVRRRQFVVGRALLRLALGRLLACSPARIALRERPGQAPALVGQGDVGFSISHSGRWVACAAASGVALGLDIERIDRQRDVMALALQAFDAPDRATVLASAPVQRHATFYRLWCRYEARIKLGVPAVFEAGWEDADLAAALSGSGVLAGALAPTPVQLVHVRGSGRRAGSVDAEVVEAVGALREEAR